MSAVTGVTGSTTRPQLDDKVSGATACDSRDRAPAPTPKLLRALCFVPATEGAVVVERPRDPVLIEIENCELGAHFELISLSDNPAVSFDDEKAVRRLDPVGYDVQNRRATIVAGQEEMDQKALEPGEWLVLRQVDRNGNASPGIYVHLDPQAWGRNTVRQTDAAGKTVDLRGDTFQIITGLVGLKPNDAADKTQRFLGVVTKDERAPAILENNIRIETQHWSKEDKEVATILTTQAANLLQGKLRRNHFTFAEAMELAKDATLPDAVRDAFVRLCDADGGLFRRLAKATGRPRDGYLTYDDYAYAAGHERSIFLIADRAFEPGVTFHVSNNTTGRSYGAAVPAQSGTTIPPYERRNVIDLHDVTDGAPLVIRFHDQAGNFGEPYVFEYDSGCPDGKARTNPLDIRLAQFKLGAS